jgi:hypothetical protein
MVCARGDCALLTLSHLLHHSDANYISYDIECNSAVLPTVFRTPGCPFSGVCDAWADEEPKNNKKGKVKMLEKVMLDKIESEMRVAAVGRHYSVNELTYHFIGKMKTKLRES